MLWVLLVLPAGGIGCWRAPPTGPAAGLPFPRELVAFTPLADGPVFAAAAPGNWDAKIRERGWVMRDGDGYKLWYTGDDGTPGARRMLGLATSPDGLAWTRHPGNPLLPNQWVEDMMVVNDGGRFLMVAEGEGDRAQLLTSADGVAWELVGRLDVRLNDGRPIPDGPYGTPTLFRDGNRWVLFYERSDAGIWVAASDDLKVWRNVQDDPVLRPGPGEYDRDMVAVNQVIRHAGRYYAYYHGCATAGPLARQWSPAVAVSDDLIRWEKYAGNPLLPPAENKSSGTVVDTGAGLRFYTTHPAVYVFRPAPER